MRDETHVGPVDAHAERDGGDDDDHLLGEEAVLVFRPDVRTQARVVRQGVVAVRPKRLRDTLHLLARQAVDDAGVVGMLLSDTWGYVLFGAAGACSLYINVILWFTEKEYVYPSRGPLRYFTYYWGFFVYWGALALAYSVIRIGGIEL